MRLPMSSASTALRLGFLGVFAAACTTEAPPAGPPGGNQQSQKRNLPCEVADLIDEHCGLCHKATPAYSAPMPLVTQADFQAIDPATGDPYYKRALERMLEEVPKKRMPPASQDVVPEDELEVITKWLEDGAPKSSAKCGSGDGDGDGDTGDGDGDTGDGDGDTGDGDTGDGDGDTMVEPPLKLEYDELTDADCDEIIELRAFDPGSPSKGFTVAKNLGNQNKYECFDFEVPFDGKGQALKIESIVENSSVVHHWLLYETGGNKTGKSYWNCAGQHPTSQLLAGWAAGRGDTQMPRDVGLKLPQKGSGHFTLEMHYNTAAVSGNVVDNSGARICVTKTAQKNEAAVHWLGTELIAFPGLTGQNVSGTCSVPTKATILSSWPHMHEMGVHMKVELTRKGATTKSVLHDKPFSFDDQRAYDTPVIVEAGDKILTTCTYEKGKSNTFGTDSESEMCYNFVLAYPAGALTNGASLTGATATCGVL